MAESEQAVSDELLTEVRALRADVARVLAALEAIARHGQRVSRVLERCAEGSESVSVRMQN